MGVVLEITHYFRQFTCVEQIIQHHTIEGASRRLQKKDTL